MSNNFIKNIPFINNLLNSQDLSITKLLDMGVRGIDLDVYSGDMNPLYKTTYQQTAHSIGNHNFRMPVEVPSKFISYLAEIKHYIDTKPIKEPILVFLENYNSNNNVKELESEILQIFDKKTIFNL